GVSVPVEALRGGSAQACRDAFESILAGERSPRSDVVALNAALALQLTETVATFGEGLELARELLRSGKAYQVVERARKLAHE
ncbi:MAG: anthranilate phosphoribosyltransferase, partial [Candidatus Baltobacteraceae bacterium]